MIKTSKIKKYIIIILLVISLTLLTNCSCNKLSNKYIIKENGVDITVDAEYLSYMYNQNTIPSIHFDYNGVKISDQSTNAKVVFVQNDQYALSDAFSNFLESFTDDAKLITRSVEQGKETTVARSPHYR